MKVVLENLTKIFPSRNKKSGEEVIDLTVDKRLSGYEVIKSTSYGKKTSVNILLYRGLEDGE